MVGSNSFSKAVNDFLEGLRLTPLWWRLGIEQTITRYRRTVLGPFWLASSTLATGAGLSLVFGSIFGGNWRDSFPFILGGMVSWSLVSGLVNDGSNAFIWSAGLMQIQRLPLSFYTFLITWRTLINFVHQLVAFWVVVLILRLFSVPHWELVFSLPFVLVTGFFLMMPVAMVATRFRDINYLIGFAIQTMFMLTPVFWRRAQMPAKLHWLVDYNPLAHLLELLRQPLLGHPAPMSDWLASAFVLVVSMMLALVSLFLFRRRVVFWL